MMSAPTTAALSLRSQPIRSVRDLLAADYNTDPDPLNRARRKWSGRAGSENKLQTLVCHDMRGGYNEDANPQGSGVKGGNAYAPWFWPLIDIFVYFSHARVTIPPLGWIQACHRNDVPCLGTLIFEWDAGSNDIKELLENTDECIDRLVSAMIYYGYDGYLLNFECELGTVFTPQQLLSFVSRLSTAAHEAAPWSKIICYDCIDKEGHLAYQCHLNDSNSSYFEACDGILIDYHWKSQHPSISVSAAGSRSKQVYMGIDVFGRGTFGGGGFNVTAAIRHCFQSGTSVGIFAPGWSFESAGGFSKGREATLRLDARIWTSAHYTVIQTDSNGWSATKAADGEIVYQRSQEVDLLAACADGDMSASILDGNPPISIFHREGSRLCATLLKESGEMASNVPDSSFSGNMAEFVGYGQDVRKLVWKEESAVQHDEPPVVWVARPPLADRPAVLKPRPLRLTLPFMTNFSQGCGSAMYKAGDCISTRPWFQMQHQDCPCMFLFDPALFPDCHSDLCLKWDRSTAFQGGNCIRCDIGAFRTATVPLFRFLTESGGSPGKLRVSVSVIPGPETSQQSLGVLFADGRCISLMLECNFWKDWIGRFRWLTDAQRQKVFEIAENCFPDANLFENELLQYDLGAIAHDFSIWKAGRLFPLGISRYASNWVALKFELVVWSPILALDWQVVTRGSTAVLYLGQVVIAENWAEPVQISWPLSLKEASVDGIESVVVTWRATDSLAWCDIYVDDGWIGRSFTHAHVIACASIKKSPDQRSMITVQPTGTNGVSMAMDNCPRVLY